MTFGNLREVLQNPANTSMGLKQYVSIVDYKLKQVVEHY